MELPNNLVCITDVDGEAVYFNPSQVTCILEHANEPTLIDVFLKGVKIRTRAPVLETMRFGNQLLTSAGIVHFHEGDLVMAADHQILFPYGLSFTTPNFPPDPQFYDGEILVE